MNKLRNILPAQRPARIFCVLALLLTFGICIGWQSLTLPYSDDFVYNRRIISDTPSAKDAYWKMQTDSITKLEHIPESVVNHWICVNGRLSNLSYITVQLIPYQVINVLCGVMMGVLALFLVLYGRRKGGLPITPWSTAVALLFFWCSLTWNENMQSSDFQFNYTFSSVIMLGVVWLFGFREKRPGWAAWLLLCIFALWHETFSLTALGFLGTLWLVGRCGKYTTRPPFVALLVLGIGALCQFSPGSADRAAEMSMVDLNWLQCAKLVSNLFIYFLGVITWLVIRRRLNHNDRLRSGVFLIALSGAALAEGIIFMTLNPANRALWPVDVLSIAYIAYLTALIADTKKMHKAIAATLLVLYAFWGASLLYWQHTVYSTTRTIIERIKAGESTVGFDHQLTNLDIPFWLMRIPSFPYGNHIIWEHSVLTLNYSGHKNEAFAVLPKGYENLPFDQWPKIPGDNDLRGSAATIARKYDGKSSFRKVYIAYFGEPTPSTSPIARVYTHFKPEGIIGIEDVGVRCTEVLRMVHMGDTLEILKFTQLPIFLCSRPIVSLDRYEQGD